MAKKLYEAIGRMLTGGSKRIQYFFGPVCLVCCITIQQTR